MGTIINITEGSNFHGTSSPTYGGPNASNIAKPSSEYADGAGSPEGRNAAVLDAAFPVSTLDLTGYDPQALYVSLLDGSDSTLAFGSAAVDGAEQYMGAGYVAARGTAHLKHDAAPDLNDVDTTSLNIPNAYVPDVTNRASAVADWGTAFTTKYSSTSEAFPPAGGDPTLPFTGDTGLDLNARDTTSSTTGLNPSATSSSRLGDWTSPTLGRWNNDDE